MKNILFFIGISLFFMACESKEETEETIVYVDYIEGQLIQVENFPIEEGNRIKGFYFNPTIINNPDSSYIKVYGQLTSESYLLLDKCNVPGLMAREDISAVFKSGFIIFKSSYNNSVTNKSTSEKIEFKWVNDRLVIADKSLVTKNLKDINVNDSLALLALYRATNGKNWTNTWDLSKPVKEWYGVELSAYKKDFGVASLKLANNNLQGALPIEVLQMDYLNLYECEFIGNQLEADIRIPNYINESELHLKLQYNDLDIISYNEDLPRSIPINGIAVYRIDSTGAKGDFRGKIGLNFEVQCIDKFSYTSNQSKYSDTVFGYKGRYIPVIYMGDTSLVFSGFLSTIPINIHPDIIKSSYSVEYIGTGDGENGSTITSLIEYPKSIIIKKGGGWESYITSISLDQRIFSLQEAYLYADNKFNNVFSKYLGETALEGIIDKSIEELGYIHKGIEKDKNGTITRIYVTIEEGCIENYQILVKDYQIRIISDGGC